MKSHRTEKGAPTRTMARFTVGLLAGLMALLAGCQAPVRPQTAPPVIELVPREDPAAPPIKASIEPALPIAPPPTPEPDLFSRLRRQLKTSHCADDREQARWIRLYAPRPDRFGARLEPMLPLLDYVLSRIESENLPGEFALIPIIESSYRPQARSPAGPAGMWQFTAGTARHFGLDVSGERDERLSVIEATNAALEFLGELHVAHGDWALAAAGYNAGAFRLRKLMERQLQPREAGQLPAGLARGTYEYIEKLKAWACMLSEPERFGIELPASDSFEPLTRVTTPARLQRLDLLSEASGLDAEALRSLNPLLRASAPARGESDLLLPEDAAAELSRFMERVRKGEIPLPEPRSHIVVAGDTLSAIAHRYSLSVAELQQWNRLSPGSILRIGQSLRLEPPSASSRR